jgi:hypothetical protein
MERQEVYKKIDSEREYQEQMKKEKESHVVEDFPLSSAILAMEHNLKLAKDSWYYNQAPYKESMKYIRKVAAICVQMGEKYGMKDR